MNITIKVDDWAATVSALCAFITLIMLYLSQKKSNIEKYEISKANFYVGSTSIGGHELCLKLKNRGYLNIKEVKASLIGENEENYEGVKVKLNHIYEIEKENTYDYEIILSYKDISNESNIKGNLVLEYTDIYGKIRKCLYEIELDTKADNLISGSEKKFLINVS